MQWSFYFGSFSERHGSQTVYPKCRECHRSANVQFNKLRQHHLQSGLLCVSGLHHRRSTFLWWILLNFTFTDSSILIHQIAKYSKRLVFANSNVRILISDYNALGICFVGICQLFRVLLHRRPPPSRQRLVPTAPMSGQAVEMAVIATGSNVARMVPEQVFLLYSKFNSAKHPHLTWSFKLLSNSFLNIT